MMRSNHFIPSDPFGHTGSGCVELRRSRDAFELLRDPFAFVLLSVIALRLRTAPGLAIDGLKQGEAMIGDHDRYGMTQAEYRNAKKRLEKYGLAVFRGTVQGTVASLVGNTVFAIPPADDEE